MAAGVLVLFWLLRADVRARFPAALRPLLDWRVLLVGAALAGALALAVTFWLSVNTARPGDVNRLDLWRSAIAMAVDHPVVGVGIYQYPAALRWYGLPTLSRSQDHLLTAHNLPLHTLAEGGAVGFAVSLGLVAVFGWLWWKAWRGAPHAGHCRRLEGVLAALVVFAVHNIYDTFPLTTMYVPLIVCVAYVVAGHVTRAQAVAGPATPGRRWPVYALLALLIGTQAAFLPVHAGTLAHGRAQAALRAGPPLEDALEAARAAHAADPWLDLYPMHEAYILGLRAADNPDDLPAAIAAHERSLDLNPSWDEGWHNLGGLYAQAGRYADAAAAAETAIAWNPVKPGYHLRLGVYREALGDAAAARAAYLEALRWHPELASSGFWTDPAHPERAGVLAGAPAHFAGRPETALRVAIAAGDLDAATGIAQAIAPEAASEALLRALAQWAAQVDDAQVAPCPACYYERVRQTSSEQYGRDYTFLAELALQGDGVAHPLDMTAEEAARAALFLSEGRAARAWYVLAQLAARDGADADAVNAMLARAAPALSTPLNFGIAVYGRPAAFEELPQARTPALARADYEPWLVLLDRLEAAGAWDDARRVAEALLRADPYLWEVRERLAALPG
ncbi:MAG: O-antigen ligase family protein [Anaerolineae bacterium]|nr:O-antigen ligase family protein [Anaerolineae bacterium]